MKRSLLAATLGALALACGSPGPNKDDQGTIPFDPQRPTPAGTSNVTPYTGSDVDVLGAQLIYPTGIDLHRKLVMRTCSGTNGVCHNQKEYPDLHTPGTFMASIGAPCNVQSGTATGVFDRCERLGDRFRFSEPAFKEIEIGWFELVRGETPELGGGTRPDETTPGLHLHLHDAVPVNSDRINATGTFIRNFINDQGDVQELAFASYETRWWVLGDRKHLFAEVRENQRDTVEGLVASGIVQGDQNRNDVYGARVIGNTVPLIKPGRPEESYLVARLRGYMKRSTGEEQPVPGTRMPLANQPPNVQDMLALMCFIEGLDLNARQWSLGSAIDYNKCSYSENPSALSLAGSGDTWSARVLPILQSNCGGCHGGENPQGGLNLLGTSHEVYERLVLKPSIQKPTMNLIQPGSLDKSYLVLKLTGDGSIVGARMPINPLNGNSPLPDEERQSIENWVFLSGAVEN
ncbi:hypothetical protein [Archangium violaceum]|uniref:hypothetical protein n=1 Tax=Archangium violaceum TaxID=83451 RepID=UPI0036DEFD70